MIDELIDRAWSCFNRVTSTEKQTKMPPDKHGSRNVEEVLGLDPNVLPDRKQLDKDFQDLIVS